MIHKIINRYRYKECPNNIDLLPMFVLTVFSYFNKSGEGVSWLFITYFEDGETDFVEWF